MSSFDLTAAVPARKLPDAMLRLAPALYAATLLLSAFLLFAIQPMFTKMVLPQLGGSPSVWSVAMVFFQAALLAGYAYAHLLARRVGHGTAALIHIGLLALAAATLPIGIASGFGAPPTSAGIAAWVVALFAASIGLPFVALSASAPLLQSWFAASGHAQARNPYVLYAASNLGSFAALFAYPFLIEPFFTLKAQAEIWSLGFAALAILVAVAGLVVARASAPAAAAPEAAEPAPPVTMADRATWIMLAAVPTGLVIAVTAYITTDVASAPFLWVIPLALYLLTFVILFRDRPWISHETAVRLVPFVVAPLAISVIGGDKVYWLAIIALNLVGFFVLALACHGELYRRRPAPAHLTEFYLWLSFGGVVGGIFSGLAAPHLFNGTYEYPVLIAIAVLAMPGAFATGVGAFVRSAAPLVLAAVVILVAAVGFRIGLPKEMELVYQIVLVGLAASLLLLREKRGLFFGLVVLSFVIADCWQPGVTRVERARSFFGVHQVVETVDGAHRLLLHGTTIHGVERVREQGKPVTGTPEPLSYFYTGGPYSEAVAAARKQMGGRFKNVAVVGLGTGTLACYRQGAESWEFFEIDPEVVRLATDPKVFRFMSTCSPAAPIVLGDARLTLAQSKQTYDLIILDAFSSDAIPVHLLTREAFRGYLTRLAPHGIIIVNVSNRHVEVTKVLAAIGAEEGLVTLGKVDGQARSFLVDFKAAAQMAVLGRSYADMGGLAEVADWHKISVNPRIKAWTDDYSDIVGAILRKKFGG